MKPGFALNLSSEDAVLLRRMPDGWQDVGSVRFEAPDLAEALAGLAARAAALAGGEPVATKLVIPNSQILYTELEATGDRPALHAAIRAGLEGLTPYEVRALVYDFEPIPGTDRLKLAVVARETLDEAEEFAAAHGFNPLCFVAIPDPEQFPREPWFGTVPNVQRRLPKGERVQRDGEPIRLLPAGEAPLAEADPAASLVAEDGVAPAEVSAPEPAAAHDEPYPAEAMSAPHDPEPADPYADPHPAEATWVALPHPEPAAEVHSAEAWPQAVVPDVDPVDPDALAEPAEAARPAPWAPESDDPPPVVAETRFSDGPAQPDAPSVDEAHPGETAHITAWEATDAAPSVPPDTEAACPHEAAADPHPAEEAPEPDGGPAPVGPATEAAEPAVAEPAPRLDAPPAVGAAPEVPEAPYVDLDPDDEELPPMPPGLVARPVAEAPRLAGEARPERGLDVALTRAGASRPQAAASSVLRAEPLARRQPKPSGFERLPPRPPAQRGKPRHLGLILTAVLLVALGAVAAWSSFRFGGAADSAHAAIEAPEAAMERAAVSLAPADPAPDPTADEAAPPAAAAEAPPEETAEAQPTASAATGDPAAPRDEIFLTAMDKPTAAPEAVDAPAPPATPDAVPGPPLPPPPYGVTYQLDERGLIRPTAEGVVAPGNFLLVAGTPSIVPPPRPGSQPAADAAPPTATPGAIFPGATPPRPAPQPDQAAAAPAPDPALVGKRPKARPATAEADEAALPAPPDGSMVASPRPRARPLPFQDSEAERAAAEAGAAAATLRMAAAPLARPEPAPEALAPTSGAISPLAIAISRKPAARPSDFTPAIEAAVAAAVRTPRVPQATARIEPEEEADEPERSVAPRIPSKANVAQKATFANAINLSKINLIGVYGTASNRYAMVRQPNGRYVKVRVGDRLDGGVVATIGRDELRYRKGGRMVALSLPRG